MIKYGKSCDSLLEHKSIFFDQNDLKLEEFQEIAAVYKTQPKRQRCKNCEQPIEETLFNKMGVDYKLCINCGQLNGGYEDTEEFCAYIYTKGKGEQYGAIYSAGDKKEYLSRVQDIYTPKVKFLNEALVEQDEDVGKLSYADIGAGSGYFVGALLDYGFRKVKGYEVSKSQVDFGNSMLGREAIQLHKLDEAVSLVSGLEAEVVSLVGVLEHLQNPREVLRAISDNPRIRYLYFSVPLFSPCIFFEIVFPQVMPRQLVAGHTHLYTESSIDWFCNEFGLRRVSEWWFGTDFVDLYRSTLVMLGKVSEKEAVASMWEEQFLPLIDSLQLVMDKEKASSEVHMLLKKP